MARLIDLYFKDKCTRTIRVPLYTDVECTNIGDYINKEYIAKPIRNDSIIKRILDMVGVLTGKYEAIYYKEQEL